MTTPWAIEVLSGRSTLSIDDALVREAVAEGFNFIDRLVREWRDGVDRFDEPGEIFLGALAEGGRIIAVGGLNRDFAYALGVGRLRHLYVSRPFRGQDVGKALVDRLEQHARTSSHTIRLRTDTVDAARFYERRGYRPVACETASHILRLRG